MSRCLNALPLASGWTLAALLAIGVPTLACAQASRQLPPNSLRGELTITQSPRALLNGQATQLAPGARIRAANNMLALPASLSGIAMTVNYTLDYDGQLMNVWVLSDGEAAQRWPKSIEEAAQWSYNPITQTWSKP